jgi:cellulose synthase/poly-beta-1,6-N-acetylglucosamine synthase-like glycosyltransferase
MTVSFLIAVASLILFIQSSTEVWRIIYSYRGPDTIDRLRFPVAKTMRENFCLIVPARHEAAVLAETLTQLAKQTHPNVDIITVINDDDQETLDVALEVSFHNPRVKVMVYPLAPDDKPSKPKQLNYVLSQINKNEYSVIGVIDAEDSVHPELLSRIDAAFRDRKIGLVQGGVQLINHDSSWYSLHNVLEYYRWFNSAMAFQADNNFIPLGGNTIFIREKLLRKAGGWPETLTEDCSLGVLLSSRFNAKTAVYYEPELATLEETPESLISLFRQRVRWNQGFYHEWKKGIWQELPNFRQRMLADYVLLGPILLSCVSLMIPLSILTVLFLEAPVGLVMLMYLPLVPAMLHMFLNAVLLHDFGRAFERKIKIRQYAILFITQAFYQIVLNTAALWAVYREMRGENSWYKTPHAGRHRPELAYMSADNTTNYTEEEAINEA